MKQIGNSKTNKLCAFESQLNCVHSHRNKFNVAASFKINKRLNDLATPSTFITATAHAWQVKGWPMSFCIRYVVFFMKWLAVRIMHSAVCIVCARIVRVSFNIVRYNGRYKEYKKTSVSFQGVSKHARCQSTKILSPAINLGLSLYPWHQCLKISSVWIPVATFTYLLFSRP